MSEYNIIQALRTIYQSSGVAPDSYTSYMDEEKAFDPTGKALWVEESFIPATSESTGKSFASSDDERGIYQLTVYTPLFTGDYGKSSSDAVAAIKGAFYNGASEVYNNQKVDILESIAQGPESNEAWNRRVISINYFAFTERG